MNRSKKTLNLRLLMLMILIVFIVLVLLLISFLQKTFLADTYKDNKISYLKSVASEVDTGLKNNNIESVFNTISYSNEVCVRVVTDSIVIGNEYKEANSCALGKLTTRQLSSIASQTIANDGEKLFDNYYFQGGGQYDGNIYIYSKLSTINNENVLILLSTNIVPLKVTLDTMSDQFNIIIIVVVLVTILLALSLSSIIVLPIKRMEKEAKNLPIGKYDSSFIKTDAKEIESLNNTLAMANEEIIKADKARKELIGNVSHDLRTPLTMIVGYGEMIRDLPEENTPENINVIIDEAKRLSTLVDDLLDMSKVETGEINLRVSDVNLSTLLSQLYHQFEPFCKSKDIKLELDIKDENVIVHTDGNRAKQILYNFVNNALQYNDAKDKKIIIGEEKINDAYRLYVYDNGSGIKEEDKEKIWNRYYKVDREHKRFHIGSGIGLSLCKEILEKMGLNYGVDSKYGEYSKFYFDVK